MRPEGAERRAVGAIKPNAVIIGIRYGDIPPVRGILCIAGTCNLPNARSIPKLADEIPISPNNLNAIVVIIGHHDALAVRGV